MGREWRTVSSISVELKVCTMTVYRLISSGRLPAVKVGRSYRISESDFQAYLRGAQADGDPRQ